MKTVFFCILAGFSIALRLAAAPANDRFADRILITGTNVTVTGNNSGANTEAGEDTGNGGEIHDYSVWYGWTAPATGIVHLSGSTAIGNFYMVISAYRGSSIASLVRAETAADGGVPVAAGESLAVQVASIYYPFWGGGGGAGPFSLTLELQVPGATSANDNYANAFEIALPVSHFEGEMSGATTELGEPMPSGINQTLWWKFVAPEDGIFAAILSTPHFSPVITLFAGSSLESLKPVPPLNSYRYKLQSGQEYALQLAGEKVTAGDFTLDTHFFSLTNDLFSGSTHLEGTNLAYVGNFTTATLEPNEPNVGETNTIWISWAAPFTGRARFNCLTANSFQWALPYTGPTLERLQPVRTVDMDNGRLDFLAIEGAVYHFQLSGGGDECAFSLQLLPWGPAANDSFAAARRWLGNQEWFPVADATTELGEPAHLEEVPCKSLWWKWVAPQNGNAYFMANRSLATNVVLAVYEGSALESLSLVAKGTNSVRFDVNGGDNYSIAAVVPANSVGDLLLYGAMGLASTESHMVPGNLLGDPSWETPGIFAGKYWNYSGSVGGTFEEPGGADGLSWLSLSGGAQIWQDFPTVPGQNHAIRFALKIGGDMSTGSGDGQVRVLWNDQPLGVVDIPEAESGFWHWAELSAVANSPTSRIAFVNMARNIELDAFSVVSLSDPPRIINQPSSASVIAGGTAIFTMGASGTLPLTYSWYFNGSPIAVLTNAVLVLESVSTNQAGFYQAIISNPYGAVTSIIASLAVDSPTKPAILWQPYGDQIAAGSFYQFTVIASGAPPLEFQWYKMDSAIRGATNTTLTFESVAPDDAGGYWVAIKNAAGEVRSLSATLSLAIETNGGGTVDFRNRFFYLHEVEAPVFDLDGFTRLNGSNYLAQLYGGASLELLRPVGQPSAFLSGFDAGYFYPQILNLKSVPPQANALLQVRAWDKRDGGTYEAARALGGKYGKSELLSINAGGGAEPAANLAGLKSFSLQAGRPQFASGEFTLVERQPDGQVVWAHHGELGFRYVVEKTTDGLNWRPAVVLTNDQNTVSFTNSTDRAATTIFYRSRILD